MRSHLLAMVAIGAVGAIVSAPAASGDGGPGPGVMQGWTGIEHGDLRYVTIPTPGWTTIETIRRNGGRVQSFTNLKGNWGIPAVAFDGTTDGLTRDGRTLILAGARTSPALRKQSTFALMDVKKMRLIQKLRIKGDHSFDAVSPDGRYLYLVEYVSAQDLSRYRVRAYDVRAGRLLAKPVVDKREGEATMQGSPVSRIMSPDGRWAYTLYGAPDKAFIHALDTRHVEAICIDLPWRSQPKRLFEFRLRLDGEGNLIVRGPRGRSLVVVDRQVHRLMNFVRNP